MWLLLAVISTLFIGVSTILSKIGIKDADPYVTGAVTNTVLLSAFVLTALFSGAFGQVSDMGLWTWVSVGSSGLVLSVSWVFYFLGLKGGSISVFLAIQSLTIVVSMMLCTVFIGAILLKKRKTGEFGKIAGKCWLFILLGAAASGAGHVLVYKALFLGKAAVIMTIYRMGMVISIILSRIFLHEKLRKKGWFGFALLIGGVVLFAAGR